MTASSTHAPVLVCGDWVLPVSSPPVRDGAVLVVGDRVEAVGPADELRDAAPTATEEHVLGSIVIPGLVNAHTHISLTALKGTVPPMAFDAWIGEIVPRIAAMTPDEQVASAQAGIAAQLAAGITCVGDITYHDESMTPAAQAGMAGRFFREVLAKGGTAVEPFLADLPADESGRVRPAISPHSPYSLGPAAIREAVRLARERGVPAMMHVAESPAEVALMERGEGPFVRLASQNAPDLQSPGMSTVRYLNALGVLDDLICVHAVHVDDQDAALLSARARGVVLCPRSNLYLESGQPPIHRYLERGVPMALGTDSAASNRDFDMFEEARAVVAIEPGIDRTRVLEMLTVEGADILGLPGHGTLASGSPADLVVLTIGATDDPVGDLIGAARKRDIAAVMSAGEWRHRRERKQ